MSKTIPSCLMITDVSITNYHRVYSTESMSGITNRKDSGIQWFKGSITLKAYGFKNIRSMNGFLASLKGRYKNFSLPLGGAYANLDLPQNPTLSINHVTGSNEIEVFHTSNEIGSGSVFTLPNDTKLYTLLDDLTGSGTYSVTPALKKDHSKVSVVNFTNPVITAFLDGNETTISHEGNGSIATATLTWSEHIA